MSPPTDVGLSELTEKIGEYRSQLDETGKLIKEYEARLVSLEDTLDALADAASSLEDCDAELERTREIYYTAEAARRYLTEAKEKFLARYTEPMRLAFTKYYSFIADESGDEYAVDANFKVSVREHGATYSTEHLSKGYGDLVGLCSRISMTDAMYKEEKPFLVFDDPFVNFDDKKTSGAMRFTREVAKDYQIIYLTCHSARSGE